MKTVLILAAAATMAALPARADDFCTALKQVIGASQNEFADIRGALSGTDNLGDSHYQSPSVVLPGAQASQIGPPCEVKTLLGRLAYACTFPGDGGDAVRAMAQKISGCNGQALPAPSEDGVYSFDSPDILIQNFPYTADGSNGVEVTVPPPL